MASGLRRKPRLTTIEKIKVSGIGILLLAATNFYLTTLKCTAINAQAAWLRCLNGAAFASLKKYPSDFFNPPLADRTERGAL